MSTATIADPVSDQDFLDPWPILDDGTEWDGMGLLDLLQANQSPFGKSLDVRALLLEIQASINVEITNVPIVTYGANHFVSSLALSFHLCFNKHADRSRDSMWKHQRISNL